MTWRVAIAQSVVRWHESSITTEVDSEERVRFVLGTAVLHTAADEGLKAAAGAKCAGEGLHLPDLVWVLPIAALARRSKVVKHTVLVEVVVEEELLGDLLHGGLLGLQPGDSLRWLRVQACLLRKALRELHPGERVHVLAQGSFEHLDSYGLVPVACESPLVSRHSLLLLDEVRARLEALELGENLVVKTPVSDAGISVRHGSLPLGHHGMRRCSAWVWLAQVLRRLIHALLFSHMELIVHPETLRWETTHNASAHLTCHMPADILLLLRGCGALKGFTDGSVFNAVNLVELGAFHFEGWLIENVLSDHLVFLHSPHGVPFGKIDLEILLFELLTTA